MSPSSCQKLLTTNILQGAMRPLQYHSLSVYIYMWLCTLCHLREHTARCGVPKALQARGKLFVFLLYQHREDGSNSSSQWVANHNQSVVLQQIPSGEMENIRIQHIGMCWWRPMWSKCPAISCWLIDSATSLLTIYFPTLNNVAMSLCNIRIQHAGWIIALNTFYNAYMKQPHYKMRLK